MTVGASVQSDLCPGSHGIVVERRDTDDGVLLYVDWLTATGKQFYRWHTENELVYSGEGGNGG
jgi:hypothetical protein